MMTFLFCVYPKYKIAKCMNAMRNAVLKNVPKNMYEIKKQARMCNKLRQFRVENICK